MKYLTRRPKKGEKVRFQMPLEGIDEGIVLSVNGSYCMIEVDLPDWHEPVIIERYWECELEYA